MAQEAPLAGLRPDPVPAEGLLPAGLGLIEASTVPGSDEPDRSPGSGQQRTYRILVLGIFVAYMAVATGLYYFRGVGFIFPDRWAVFLFVGAILLGQGLAFLRDWVPFVLLVFGYEYMRGVAGDIVTAQGMTAEQHGNIRVESLIAADRALFGGELPTLWLQRTLHTPGTVHWYDVLAALIYLLHFVLPLVFAFTLWIRSKERFWQFSLAFLLMTYVAFAFFLFYPAAPPWLADRWGFIHGTQFPFDQTFPVLMPHRYDNFEAISLWEHRSPNPVAAMPSLHASFPWLVLLFAVKFYGRWGLLFIPYNLVLWFAAVYSANHWAVDVLVGVAWATVCFVVVLFAWPSFMRGIDSVVPRPVRAAAARAGGAISRPFALITAPIRRLAAGARTVGAASPRRTDRT